MDIFHSFPFFCSTQQETARPGRVLTNGNTACGLGKEAGQSMQEAKYSDMQAENGILVSLCVVFLVPVHKATSYMLAKMH